MDRRVTMGSNEAHNTTAATPANEFGRVPPELPGNMLRRCLTGQSGLTYIFTANASHPILALKRFIPTVKSWGMEDLEDLEAAFERVEHSGFPGTTEDSQIVRSARESYVNGHGRRDVRAIQAFFFKLTGDLKVWISTYRPHVWEGLFPNDKGKMDDRCNSAQEITDAFDSYLELYHWLR